MNHIEKFSKLLNQKIKDEPLICFRDNEIEWFVKNALEEAGLMLVPKSDSEWENQNNA